MTKFLQYLESPGKLEKTFSTKYIEVYISRKIIVQLFITFFHKGYSVYF